jgi:hypothetical protein
MLRSVIAAGFPLFTRQMFANLGIQWAGTLLGCIAAVMIPIPICVTGEEQDYGEGELMCHADNVTTLSHIQIALCWIVA